MSTMPSYFLCTQVHTHTHTLPEKKRNGHIMAWIVKNTPKISWISYAFQDNELHIHEKKVPHTDLFSVMIKFKTHTKKLNSSNSNSNSSEKKIAAAWNEVVFRHSSSYSYNNNYAISKCSAYSRRYPKQSTQCFNLNRRIFRSQKPIYPNWESICGVCMCVTFIRRALLGIYLSDPNWKIWNLNGCANNNDVEIGHSKLQ